MVTTYILLKNIYIDYYILHTSCWGQDKKGICVVKKSKKKEWEERLLCLKQQIEYWINPENVTNKTIESVQLYYDI